MPSAEQKAIMSPVQSGIQTLQALQNRILTQQSKLDDSVRESLLLLAHLTTQQLCPDENARRATFVGSTAFEVCVWFIDLIGLSADTPVMMQQTVRAIKAYAGISEHKLELNPTLNGWLKKLNTMQELGLIRKQVSFQLAWHPASMPATLKWLCEELLKVQDLSQAHHLIALALGTALPSKSENLFLKNWHGDVTKPGTFTSLATIN